MPRAKSATVMVGVGAGSRHEEERVRGLFHFIEHMAFKGTKKRPSTLKISSEIEGVGGEFNAFTDKELTAYYIKLSAAHLEMAFDILSDMLQNSLYKPEEIEREKGVIIEEINMRNDTPMVKVWEIFVELLYGDNPMGWDTAGEPETIRAIKRQDFLAYLSRLYFPKNMVIAVAGGVEPDLVRRLVEKYFGGIGKTGQKITQGIKIHQIKARTKLISKKTDQAHFCLGVPGYDFFHPDRYVLSVLAAILGGGMSSRLFSEIRERRGLAYYVSCELEYFVDSGYMLARSGVRLNKIDEAIKVAQDQFELIKTKKVREEELRRSKEMLKGQLILSLEDSKNIAGRYLNQLLLEKKLRTPRQTLELINKVTAEDIQRVAKDVLRPGKLNLALIGPYKNEDSFAKLLKN